MLKGQRTRAYLAVWNISFFTSYIIQIGLLYNFNCTATVLTRAFWTLDFCFKTLHSFSQTSANGFDIRIK